MRFGFWMPVFGGWLRNVEDEGMPATFAYQRELAQQADRDGWDVTLIAELNLNDIKGPEADCLEAWTTAAALAPLTERLELMAAVRPNFRLPALVAKEAATIDRISNGRFTLNVVSAWWETEARQYGATWIEHDERYARTEEFLAVLKGMWTKDEDFLKGSRLGTKVSLEDYRVSIRGLGTGLVGTPDQVADQVRALERIGIDLLLLQSSPQREEMERFSSEIFPLVNHA